MGISRFAGKVAICTASTTGIGYAAAERIAREGAKVVICSRRQEKVDAAVKKLRGQDLEVSGIVCHQAKKVDRQKLIEFTLTTYGGIDLLFVSAGVNPSTGPMLSYIHQIFPGETELRPAKTLFQRYGDPAKCGAVVAFLLSEDASFMTGEIISLGGSIEYFPMSKM